MSEEPDNRLSPEQEKMLDRLLAASTRAQEERSGAEPSESDLDAFFGGTATQEQQEKIWAAVEGSPRFRAKFVKLVRCVDATSQETADPVAQQQFEEVDVPPMPESGRSTSVDRRRDEPRSFSTRAITALRGLVLNPAFAYVLAAVLISYPTYRWLSTPKTGRADPATSLGQEPVRFDGDNRERSGGEGEMKALVVTVSPTSRVLSLLLEVDEDDMPEEQQREAKERFVVTITRAGEIVWLGSLDRSDFMQGTPLLLPVQLDVAVLAEGDDFVLKLDFFQEGHDLDTINLLTQTFRLRFDPASNP